MFIKTPNLPASQVGRVICGAFASRFEKRLNSLGVEVIYSQDCKRFTTALKSHCDLFVNYLGDGLIVTDTSQNELKKRLEAIGMKCVNASRQAGPVYPDDCILNCVVTDTLIICNKPVTDSVILDYALSRNLRIINVRQGYTKCSVLTVTDEAFITDDESIYNGLIGNNLDVLLVRKGSVALWGYNYGFIGGCAGKIAPDMMVFFGDVKKHSDYSNVKAFLANYSVEPVSLSDGQLIDAGGLIPITEK